MKFSNLYIIFVFAFTSFVAASQPGQEDAPLVLLYQDKIWSQAEIGNSLLNVAQAREQLKCARLALSEAKRTTDNVATIAFYKEAVRIKQKQLVQLTGHGFIPHYNAAVKNEPARRYMPKQHIVIFVKKKQ